MEVIGITRGIFSHQIQSKYITVSVDINSNNSVPLPLTRRQLDVQLHSVILFIFISALHFNTSEKTKSGDVWCVVEFKTLSPSFACETIPALV